MFSLSASIRSLSPDDERAFFVMSSRMIPKLASMRTAELKGYDVNGATIHFTSDKPLPVGLVKKLVRERIAENEKRWKQLGDS
jgi:uncharacterized protein YdhG (YjbR/CyaY superfamily)